VGALLILATRRVVRPDRLATASLIAILLTSGLADLFGISTLLSCLFLGVALANLTPEKEEIGHAVFANFENAILSVFFTLAGMELNFGYAAIGGVVALVMVAARFAGKLISTRWAMRLAGATARVRRYLGLALIPQAGVAVGLLFVIKEDPTFASIADLLLAVGITSVLINEIIGPVLTRWALVRSGDYGMDRARLMDFIHEENITTDLRASTMTEAIAQLTDLLIRSHHLEIDRDQFLESVLAREELASTCIGAGLAVPHGQLPSGSPMVGVMGISRHGLPFGETPDGNPLHSIVLLGTPAGEGERHLEVLAALSRAVADYNIRLQLYNARSPAHACEVLMAEELEDINYFYED